ncbi:DUF1007 family protein [Budvicia aquatica]|uniref:ABC-type uncharacterized transport system, periplasmic component n=1 Tax=Budvicia aquatica TaxID=82979 RepID=A0A2C6DTF9_9GAMM|nr:DUF1007 family protein [Budvicia aquatica]PHI31983.1 DUF1007 domain-containing protein [Budvicia aquatica]VFS53033.1 ABC-type uncharacterized transport system, periplasmic component [Budvicia aquatica]
MIRILALILSMISPFVWAHPHSFIDLDSSLVTENQTITGINMVWSMDEMTSAELLHDASLAKDSPAIWQSMADELIANAAIQNYFTEMRSGGQPVEFGKKPEKYALSRKGNKAILSFVLPLEKPVSLVNNVITISTYEQSYYVDMSYVEDDNFRLPADIAASCSVSIDTPKPDASLLDYAQSLDKDDAPEEDMALGSQFAQTVTITCK